MSRRVLLPGTRRLPAAAAPDLRGRSHRVDVELRAALGRSEGVLLACGDGRAGTALHVERSRLVHTYHHGGTSSVVTSEDLTSEVTMLAVELTAAGDEGAAVVLLADGAPVGRGRIERPARARLALAGLDVGLDRGPGVGDYRAPFSFTGSIRQVVVRTDPSPDLDQAAAMAVELATG